ncbi:MAG TPA: hypothetical protein VHB20_07915 [Verrucomicrobiae bacterium]|jgi:hypothetical protein|nr:hypothetical protein [Verrucomicrobiae bacterium]
MKNALHTMLGLTAALLFLTVAAQAQDKSAQLAIITAPGAALSDVSLPDVGRYFKAEKNKAPDGTKIVIVMMDVGRPERDAALKGVYKMSEAEYNDYFVGATFTGAVQAAPKALGSPAAMKKFVAETPGAIGYLRASDADDSVKVLKVDGKAPGEAGYALAIK